MKICFVSATFSPDFLGGSSLFHNNLIRYIRSNHKEIDITWLYFGDEEKEYEKDGVKYVELKSSKSYSPFLLRNTVMIDTCFFPAINFCLSEMGEPPSSSHRCSAHS